MGTDFSWDQLNQLALSIESLRLGKYSDFQIRCKDDTVIKTHRAIVCTRSRVLAAAIDGQFKEAVAQEYHMNDDEPSIVGKMIDYLYTLDYDDHCSSTSGAKSVIEHAGADDPASLLVNAKVYVIADKYEIEALKKLACLKYTEVLPNTWNTSNFSESASHVFENTVETDRILRDVIVQVASDNIRALLDRGEFVDLLKRHGDIGAEIMRKVVNRYDQVEVPPMDPSGDKGWGESKKKRRIRKESVG